MSDDFALTAEPRADVGKGASRRLRRLSDLVPAVIYGAGKDAVSVSIPHKDLQKALENEAFYSHIISLKVGRKKDKVILKDLQRHPAKDLIMHADFLRVSMDQKIHIHIPIHFLNEDTCIGVKESGGNISHMMVEIEISCLPGDLPEFIGVDMANIDVGESIHLSDVVVPEGVDIIALHHGDRLDQTVVAVHAYRAPLEDDLEDEAGEGEEAAEGDASEEQGDED